MHTPKTLGWLLLALALGACGASKPETPATAATPAEPEPAPTSAEVDAAAPPTEALANANFDALTKEDKKRFMKEVVMPPMREAFKNFDAEEYGKITCGTCHGTGAKEGHYEMPNPLLERLPQTSEGFKALAERHPKELAFMKETVSPLMAKLLGEAPYNPETHEGFGCFGCHMAEGAEVPVKTQ